jgi:predicted RNase H-like nuclease
VPSTCVIGFDSAWTDKPDAPGAICSIRIDERGRRELVEPRLASFADALDFITAESAMGDRCLVALDQPTIVPKPHKPAAG